MTDDPTFDKGELDPEIEQISRGLRLFEVHSFRQQADDPDTFGAWSAS